MKFAEDIFPKGTFPEQKTDGAYINEYLATNLDILAKTIANDMHHLIIISGHDGVGNGKSTMLTQIGSYLTWKINQMHKVENTFTANNLVWKGEALIERSLELPKLSVIGLDEGDDLTTHGMKALAVKLKTYFRKCRQLNQILIMILPSYFELPKFYALARSVCLIDVKFYGEFERGFFSFYSARKKKLLYLKGKKEWDYDIVKPDFDGKFFSSYCFFPDLQKNIEKYKADKYSDLRDEDDEEDKQPSEREITKKVTRKNFKMIYDYFNKGHDDRISVEKLTDAFGVTTRTGFAWLKEEKECENEVVTEE